MARRRETESDFLFWANMVPLAGGRKMGVESRLRDREEFQFGYSVSEKPFDTQARLSSQRLGREVCLDMGGKRRQRTAELPQGQRDKRTGAPGTEP